MAVLETLHIACAVLWLGNFVVTGFWSIRAWSSAHTALRTFAAREILATDLLFTLVFGSAVTISGILLAQHEQLALWGTFWTRTALETVAGAGIAWAAILLPLEFRMRKYASTADESAFNRAFLIWNLAGWSVTLALFGVIYLMVEKPV